MAKHVYILFILITTGISAQVKFEATVSKTVCKVNENVQLVFTSNSSGDLEFPNIKNAKVVAGPMTGYSTNMTIMNGKRTVETNYTYTYIIRFTKKGDQVISPASYTVSGKTYHSQPITVSVGEGNNNSAAAGRNENIFITITLNKSKIHRGEHVLATYRLYSAYRRLSHQIIDLKYPTQQGFWKQDIENASQLNMDEETVNGKRYGVVVLKKQILYAQSEGKLKFEPFECTVRVSDFFNSEDFEMTSNAPSVEVLPLPENAPEGYNGAVGNFSFNVNYSKSELKVNDGLDITIIIKGNGNLKLLDEFVLDLPSEIEKFDPEVSDTINVNASGMSGTRTYKYLVIPRSSGKYKFPPITFSYFDPATNKYKTLSSGEFELQVLKGDGTADNTVIRPQGRLKVIDQNIRHLRSYENDKMVKGDYFFGSSLFYLSFLAGPFIVFLAFIIRKKSKSSEAQLSQQKVRKATRTALKHMKHAKTLLDGNDPSGFYEEAMKAIYEYTSLKLGLKNADFTKENIRRMMEVKEVSQENIQQFVSIIETCEMARYGNQLSGNENHIYNESIRLIESMEDKL